MQQIFISILRKKRLCLLDEAKKYIHDDCNVAYVFADINCNTVAKLKDGSFKFFDSIASFNSLSATSHSVWLSVSYAFAASHRVWLSL